MHDTFASMFSVRKKRAMITGGAMGIGRASATALAMGGADVAIVDCDERIGRKTAEAIQDSEGVEATFFQCDVSDPQQVQTVMSQFVERFGRLDIAVNSAGVVSQSSGIHQSEAAWGKTIGINLTGLWFCTQAQAMQMCKQPPSGGKIINIASAAARNASSDGAYCASKAGVVQLTRSLATQLGAHNINVNSISPGVVMTRLLAASLSPAQAATLREITPVGHIGRTRDMYGAVLFLASAASDFVTGHDLLIDGGRTLSTWPLPKRQVPPRISESEEIEDVKQDLEAQQDGT